MCVDVVSANAEDVVVAVGDTGPDGTYRIGGLPAGTYKVRFSDCYRVYGFGGIYEWYEDEPDFASATPIAVAGRNELAGVDALIRAEQPH